MTVVAVEAVATAAAATADVVTPKRRALKRGNNQIKTVVLPEWTQAQESLNDLDSFLSAVECCTSPESSPASAPIEDTLRISTIIGMDTTESSSEELSSKSSTDRVVSALIRVAAGAPTFYCGSIAADEDAEEYNLLEDAEEYNLLEDQPKGEYNLIEDGNGLSALLRVETENETESSTDGLLIDIESCPGSLIASESCTDGADITPVAFTTTLDQTEAELEVADLVEAESINSLEAAPRRATAWERNCPTTAEEIELTNANPPPSAHPETEVWFHALDAALRERVEGSLMQSDLRISATDSAAAQVKEKDSLGRFNFDFGGRMLYTASEVIVDGADWNEGRCNASVDVYPKKKKGIRRQPGRIPASESSESDPVAADSLPTARHGRSFVQRKQSSAMV